MRYRRSNLVPGLGSGSTAFAPAFPVGTGTTSVQAFAKVASFSMGASDASFTKACKVAAIVATIASTVSLSTVEALQRSLPLDGLALPTSTGAAIDRAASAMTSVSTDLSGWNIDPILEALSIEAVEDGVDHQGEQHVAAFVKTYGAAALSESVLGRIANGDARAAGLLSLVGRSLDVASDSRARLVTSGLASPNVEVRDAAAQAAELWDDPSLTSILRAHREPVPWLADYIERVASHTTR